MYQKSVLDNSVRVVTERIPHSRTVAVGIWADVGSRDEHDLNNGCAHFVEHMLFKGTNTRSARDIAMELDVLGGMSNAFTSRETTCLYSTVLDNHLERIVELFADLFQHSVFAQEEVERERQVILQEINMVEDTPDDQIHDHFSSLLWGRHPLGNTILGSREVVAAMDSQKLLDYASRYYVPEKILIAAAGNIEHDQFSALCGKRFSGLKGKAGNNGSRAEPSMRPVARKLFTKPLEQVHMILGTYGLPVTSKDRYKLILLNILLGGNMSSRLFQEIREKRGLAYSIYSYIDSYVDSGYLGIYMGVDQESVNEALPLIGREVRRLKEDRVSEVEMANARDFAKSSLFLAAENMEARMTRLARNELCFDRYISFDEVAAAIDKITSKDLIDLADQIFSRELSSAVLGPLEPKDIDWSLLQ